MRPYMNLSMAVLLTVTALAGSHATAGEAAEKDSPEALRKGKNYIETKVYPLEDDLKILEAFEGLRVTDCTDGMDAVGLPDVGLMSPAIHPLWKDTEHYRHRIIGIAVTARYVPAIKPLPRSASFGEFDKWVGKTYGEDTPEPFVPLLRKGSVLVIDEAPNADVGSIGSNNIMGWTLRGCVGVVTSNTARDTDEIIAEKVPLYFRQVGRGIRPGRNRIESVNRPIVCGGALVRPGDVIVADGDGVLCIPREAALDVAAYAKKTLDGDKAGRRGLYKELGLPEDDSVK